MKRLFRLLFALDILLALGPAQAGSSLPPGIPLNLLGQPSGVAQLNQFGLLAPHLSR